MPENNPRYTSPKKGCVRWDVSHAQLYREMAKVRQQGKTPARKLGRKTMIDVDVMDEHFDSLPPAEIKAPDDNEESMAAPTPATTAASAPARKTPRKPASSPVATPLPALPTRLPKPRASSPVPARGAARSEIIKTLPPVTPSPPTPPVREFLPPVEEMLPPAGDR